MQKTFPNDSGDILVRQSPTKMGCGIVEMMHLYDKENKSGCVIGYWELRKSDDEHVAEFRSVHDRFAKTEYVFDIMEAVRYGQKLAELIIESEKS